MTTALTTGRPWRVIVVFAVPLLIGNVVQQLYQFVDAVVVGRQLGVDALAAVGATGSMLFLLLGFGAGVLNVLRSAGMVTDAGIRSPDKKSDEPEKK